MRQKGYPYQLDQTDDPILLYSKATLTESCKSDFLYYRCNNGDTVYPVKICLTAQHGSDALELMSESKPLFCQVKEMV